MSPVRQIAQTGIFVATLVMTANAALAASPVEGTWLTVSKSEITISPCAEGYCGLISKIVIPDAIKAKYGNDLQAIGTNYFDANNQDPSLRGRPIMGLQILTMKGIETSPGRLDGSIYNAEDGKTYSGYLEVVDSDRLRLTGCVIYVLCRAEEWTRVPGDAASN